MRVYIKNKKSSKFQNFILIPGVRKTDFYDFSGIFLRKPGPGIWESRVRRPGNAKLMAATSEAFQALWSLFHAWEPESICAWPLLEIDPL